jgi:hypothetical protein
MVHQQNGATDVAAKKKRGNDSSSEKKVTAEGVVIIIVGIMQVALLIFGAQHCTFGW